MNLLKKNKKLILGIIIGLIVSGTVVYATGYAYAGSGVSFDNTNANLTKPNGDPVETIQEALEAIYTKTGTIQAQLNTCQSSLPDTSFKLGDYFSLTPTLNSFTIKANTTGYTSDQTINPSELTLWRVIDIHSDGSVDAVSEYVSSTDIYFRGTTGFANLVGGLQTIAASYAKEGYTIDTRMMGYGGQTATIQDTGAFDGTINRAPSITTTERPTSGIGQEYNGGVLGDTLYLKDYQLVSNVYISDTTVYGSTGLKAYKVNATSTAGDYWLSSRAFYSSYGSYDAYFGFCGRHISANGSLSILNGYVRIFNTSWSDYNGINALRPIITLKSGVTLSGGSGTKASPYTIS